MPSEKAKNQEELLRRNVIVRVTETVFNKLEKMNVENGSSSIVEVVQKFLSSRKIKIFQQDITMNAPMEDGIDHNGTKSN